MKAWAVRVLTGEEALWEGRAGQKDGCRPSPNVGRRYRIPVDGARVRTPSPSKKTLAEARGTVEFA